MKKSRKKHQMSSKKGITLVALVITIIILIILATVAINFAFGDNGLIKRAEDARDYYANDTAYTDASMANMSSYLGELLNEETGGSQTGEIIESTESYVGYYADVDGNGSVDGIIYVDLADSEKASGRWNDNTEGWSDYEYTPVTEGLKEYTVSEETYTGFNNKWEKPVVTAVKGSQGEERFYVMALEDVNQGKYYCWYDAAYDDGGKLDQTIEKTVNDFGEGKAKTAYVMNKWINEDWGPQNDNGSGYLDMCGVIQEEVEAGWFVPSKSEWSAFGCLAYDEMGVNTENCVNYGLSDRYWSSSQYNAYYAYLADFNHGYINGSNVGTNRAVRLSATF